MTIKKARWESKEKWAKPDKLNNPELKRASDYLSEQGQRGAYSELNLREKLIIWKIKLGGNLKV